ncbi:MAG: hypothetical protein D6689_14495 [Deltaproteobacteria bacterium]|nr:MAG: hypothetical protein D6689_14495 [Deltaproteobacteria bacterium]
MVSRLPNRFVRAATQVSQMRSLASLQTDDDAPTACDAGPAGLDASARRAMAALEALGAPPAAGGVISGPWSRPAPAPPVAQPVPPPPPPAVDPAAPAPATARQGKVLCVFGCRGGAGATTLAVNTAAALARAGKRVCVMDLDLQLGDVFVALDLAPETSIAALAREASTIDGAALRRRLARHDAGFYAITQTGRIDDIDEHLVERLPALLATLTSEFDYVVVDGIRDFGDYALSVLDMADSVALVVTQDVAAVRRAARVVTLFRQLGYSDRKLRLVVNRCARRAAIPVSEIERALAMPAAATVRNDYKRVRGAMDDGALIADVARTSGVAKDIDALAGVLAGRTASEAASLVDGVLSAPAAKRGWFRRRRNG